MKKTIDWYEANRRYLIAAIGVVQEALERHASRVNPNLEGDSIYPPAATEGNPSQMRKVTNSRAKGKSVRPESLAQRAFDEAEAALPSPSALQNLCSGFSLTEFERNVLLLCAGMELDSSFGAVCSAAQPGNGCAYPTFGLALAALPHAHWSAITPAATLRRWQLIEVQSAERLTAGTLRIHERILLYLLGIDVSDDRLRGLLELVQVAQYLPPSQLAMANRMSELWAGMELGSACPVFQLCGNDHTAASQVAAVACAAIGFQLQRMRACDLPSSSERELLARLWEREAILSRSGLFVDAEGFDGVECERSLLPLLETVRGIVIVNNREPLRARNRHVIRLEVNKPTLKEQRKIWQTALGPSVKRLNGQIDLITTQFNLGFRAIHAVSAEVLQQTSGQEAATLGSQMWNACRVYARPRLDDLAHRIEPTATWDDLVLPKVQIQILRNIAAHVRRRNKVYESWGFAAKGSRGLGISALFSGPSGTGKTMAAEVLANELQLDLYRIDLSAMVSKYIGETEKNLRRVFDAAEEGGVILLFDEADALFGKRSEVKDSHDRYANIEVSYLLQRMESYSGLAVLTTNLKNILDPSFLRRIRFIVPFPFPDTAQRVEIWMRVFPVLTPRGDLDVHRLAQLNLSGGNIRNIALNAAFLAADASESVSMRHLLLAAQGEYAKLEKTLTDSEIGGWS